MIPAWSAFLQSKGARVENGGVSDFGDPRSELASTRDKLVLADLSDWGLIAFSGEESGAFLHGQVTNDLRGLSPEKPVFAGYCSAKGRLLANFLVFKRDEDILLMLPEPLREPIQKRLSMFILRAKTKARDAGSEWVRMGLAGPGAGALLSRAMGGDVIADGLSATHTESAFAVHLGDGRFDVLVRPESAPAVWGMLSSQARPVGVPAWTWLMVNAGIPAILPETQDQFVPQMANMDVLHGISFEKGCYPGQEIVARTHYLGKQKRRLYLAHVDGTAAAGDSLFSPDLEGQPCGMVANAAAAPDSGMDLLAVLLTSCFEGNRVHLGAMDGPKLLFRPLPYVS